MITSFKNYDQVKVNYFGEEKYMDVFCTGDGKYEGDRYKNVEYDLNEKELEVLNWFLENVKIEDYRQEIVNYCNDKYSMWCATRRLGRRMWRTRSIFAASRPM
ncbi:hypothetical protein IKG13_00095 [Candidatus Saccharibacteria bacterium]|nr:hypothetical protein [Candidatus Saccharibacteria bacterium]MBR3377773.1 hypothetical protein [Candidatus Saccharibacteria bacterium]